MREGWRGERKRGTRERRIERVAPVERSKGESRTKQAAIYAVRKSKARTEAVPVRCRSSVDEERRRFSNREGRTNRTNSRDDRRLRERQVKRR